jgi:subtilase family serine protease
VAAAVFAGSASTTRHGGKVSPSATIFVPSGSPAPAAGAPAAPVCRFLCYSPQQLQQAYDFPTGPGAPTGAGQTIVVGVAFGSPTLQADLDQFNATFALPPATVELCGAPNSGAPDPGLAAVWGPETSADIEYAHAMAPGARLVLVVSPSDDFADMADVEASCLRNYPGAILIQSFGEDETDANDPAVRAAFDSLHATYRAVVRSGGTVIAAGGDFGATGINCDPTATTCTPVAEYPASDPLVTAVGGTMGNPYPDGLLKELPVPPPPVVTPPSDDDDVELSKPAKPAKPAKEKPKPAKPLKKKFDLNQPLFGYGGEQVWNESDTFGIATGGAPSILFPRPSYQRGFTDSLWRTTNDVAYDAAVQGGEAVVYAGRLGVFAGTSIGPAHWAAIVALANELRAKRGLDSIGLLNPALYDIARDPGDYARDFHDITTGNNSVGGPGFDAGPGYDLPTGLGTPDAAHLIADLVGQQSKHQDDDNSGRRDDNLGGKWKQGIPKLHAG